MRQLLLNCLIIYLLGNMSLFAAPAYPKQQKPEQLTLSLSDAVLLAVRENPNVQSSQLGYISEKFNLWIQEWQFMPHYALQASAGFGHVSGSSSSNYNLQPAMTWLSPIGTQVTLSASNSKTRFYNPGVSFEVMQPLMRGFGRAIVETALCNARDSLVISRLNNEGVLRSTVTEVVNAYLDVVSAEKKLSIDKGALERAEQSVEQTRLFIKAGRKAGNELVTVQANAATARTDLENDRNSLLQAKNALLTAIGLDPSTEVKFTTLDVTSLIKKFHLPDKEMTKGLVLANDVSYQEANIILNGSTTRSLLVAEDNTRWQLQLNANVGAGSASGGGSNAGFNSLFNSANQSQAVGLTLNIPIDDQLSKQAVMNAKIALQQARLALKQNRWKVETSAINGWNTVVSAEKALQFAQDAENLQEKTYNISYQKYLHGLIDSLELQSALVSSIKAQQSLLGAQISYLKSLVNLDQLMGHTLKTWDVRVKLK